ncbi:reverse transcriptase domain-containing protein [Tanacetum coccineum]
MIRSRRSRDTTKYCYFHEDHGHDTNDCRQLRHHIEEAVKSGQLSHLVKGIKKGKTKVSDTQQSDRKKENKETTPVEAPILMISRQDHTQKRKSAEEPINGLGEITFPPVSGTNNSFDPVIIIAWISGREVNQTYANMTGIPRTIMVGGKSFNTEHKLNEYKHIKPIKQKRRGLGSDRKEAACREVEELTKAGILRKVESVSGFRSKCFLDAYKGYHQIQMAEEDEDKTTFFVGKEVFCYQKMPFELKNAGATYQRLVDKVFGDQIRINLEAYIDDMVIKSTSEDDMLQDIQETFDRFRNKGQLAKGQGSDRSRAAKNAQRD